MLVFISFQLAKVKGFRVKIKLSLLSFLVYSFPFFSLVLP
jgi:hypothetical protein